MSNAASQLPARRGAAMFWRLWRRSISLKRSQPVLAVTSLLVGAAVSSLLLNLYGDVHRRMTEDFRSYGANVLVASSDAGVSGGESSLIAEEVESRLNSLPAVRSGGILAPSLFAVLRIQRLPPDPRLPSFSNIVAVGTDFAMLRRLNPAWEIAGTAGDIQPGACVLGARVASQLRVKLGDDVDLAPSEAKADSPRRFRVAGIVTSGTAEDDQVFLSLSVLQHATGLTGKIALVQLSIPGGTAQVESAVKELRAAFPALNVSPIRQIVYSEGRVLGTIRWLLLSLTLLILVIIALCVMATMTAIVLEHHKDIAVMKALGAGDWMLMRLFLAESAGLGLMGGLAGFAIGASAARDLGARLFGVALTPVWWTLPVICAVSALLAMASSLLPVRIVHRVQPAVTLKGD